MPISHRSHRLRLVGSPGVQQLHGGRYRLTFKLVTTNPREDWYNSNKSNIFADYGSLQSAPFDTNGVQPRTGEAYDDMCLVKASAGAEGDGYSVVFVYETLTSTFVNESEDKVDFELNGLKRIVRTRIAKNDATLSGTIGTTAASTTEDDVILAKREDDQLAPDEGGFRRVVETYMQKGVLLIDVANKYGTKATDSTENEFQIATIKAIGLTSTEALNDSGLFGFSLLDEGRENVEGLSAFTYRFTKGSGEISRTTTTEGLVTNVVITSVNEAPDDTDIGVVTKTDVQAREDALIYTYTFSSGSGTLETKTSTKYNGELTITTVRSLNTVPDVAAGAYQISASSEVSGVFTIHTITYASGSGEIGSSVESKYDGTLTITTKTSLNAVPTMSATTISTDVQNGDYGQIYVYKFASGSGEIGSSVENKYDGALTVTTKTNLNSVPSMSATLISSEVRDTDFGQIYTYKFASGSGEIGRTEEKKYDDKLTLTTITSLNTAPSGSGALIRTQVDDTDFGQIFRYTYATGTGRVSRDEVKKYNNKLTITTDTHLNEPGSAGSAYVMETSTRSTDFGELNTIKYASGTGQIRLLTAKKYNDVITVTTRVHLNETADTGSDTVISTSTEQGDFGEIHTAISYSGSGQIQNDVTNKYNGELTITTLGNINGEPSVPGGSYLMKTETQETEYGEIIRKTFAEGEGEISNTEVKKYNDVITVTTRKHLNEAPPSNSGTVINTATEQGDFGEVHTEVSYSGSGEIRNDVQSLYDGELTVTTLANINDEPTVPNDAYLMRTEVTQSEYGAITSKTFAEGEGKIGEVETEKYGGKLIIKTETYLNEPSPDTPSDFTLISTEQKDGNYGFIASFTYAKGEGEISNTEENRQDGSKVNSYVVLGDTEPTPPDGSYLLEKTYQASDGYDIYTYYYYSKPDGYTANISTTWNKPSTLAWDRNQGFHISDVGSLESITGEAVVTFDEEQPGAVAIADLSVGAIAKESVKYVDGTRLVRTTTFTNTYYNNVGTSFTGGNYLGEAASVGAISSSGQDLPSGEVTLAWESVPYFYAGGTTIWKTTHTKATIT